MKVLITVMFISSAVIAAPAGAKKTLPVTKEDKIVKDKLAQEKLKKIEGKKEEDCDEKAKKPIEIKPQSISLTGNAGCSLDDAH